VLARHGLNVLEGELDELAQTIQASAVRDDIVAALDDWARAETDRQRWPRVLRLANLADEPDAWRQAVRQSAARGDVRWATRLVREVGKGKPTPGVVLLLAEAFPREREEPMGLLRRLQLERPRDFWVSFTLGSRLLAQKKHQEAAECYLVAVALRPDSAPAHTALGVALADKGKVDQAIACHKKAIASDPNYAQAHYNLGVALRAKGKLDEAIECWRKAIASDPKFAPAHSNLGNALYVKGQVDEAIVCYHRAIALDPKNAEAHSNLGNALKAKGKVDEAIACFHKAVALAPKNAIVHYNLGLALRAKGKLDQAIACFHKAIELDPKYAHAHTALGVALYGKGKVDEAIACYHKAIELEPGFPKVIDIDPRFALPHYNLGNALKQKGQVEEAIACWRRAIELDPKLAEAHANLGHALQDKGKLGEAIECFKKAIALDPRLDQAHGALGEALLQRGKFTEAQKALRRCLALLPPDSPQRPLALQLRRECRRLIDADGKLKALLAGKDPSADAPTLLRMAFVARGPVYQLPLTAARLYRDAFTADGKLADNVPTQARYNAACAAALAAAGRGKDADKLDDNERATWRRQALAWLRADLAWWRNEYYKGDPKTNAAIERQLRHWQTDADLAAVRDKAALANLPDAERKDWQKFWTSVEKLRRQAAAAR
jgi:tetratricopeptide (TPR) repeat protein